MGTLESSDVVTTTNVCTDCTAADSSQSGARPISVCLLIKPLFLVLKREEKSRYGRPASLPWRWRVHGAAPSLL